VVNTMREVGYGKNKTLRKGSTPKRGETETGTAFGTESGVEGKGDVRHAGSRESLRMEEVEPHADGGLGMEK